MRNIAQQRHRKQLRGLSAKSSKSPASSAPSPKSMTFPVASLEFGMSSASSPRSPVTPASPIMTPRASIPSPKSPRSPIPSPKPYYSPIPSPRKPMSPIPSPKSPQRPASSPRHTASLSVRSSRNEQLLELAARMASSQSNLPSTVATPLSELVGKNLPIRMMRPVFLKDEDEEINMTRASVFLTGFVLSVILFGLLLYVTLWMSKGHGAFGPELPPMACGVVSSEQLVVSTSSGTVYGEAATLVHASDNSTRGILRQFFGIPYGLPPEGASRFRMTRASSYFTPDGVWNATSHGPPCPQNGLHYADCAEDCLTMSIWAPFVCDKREPLKPVLVAVSGEWLQTGDVRDHENSWQDLALLGDVIVIVVNYRLGIMGFFNGEPSDAPGNVGIYDVFMALVWIRNNAAAFHGDRDLIVALGHGSGAYVFSLDLLANTTSRRYFRRLLLHGLSMNSMFPRNDESSGVALMQRAAPCPVDQQSAAAVTRCLRSKKHKELLDVVNASLPLRFVPSRYRPPLATVSQTDLWTDLAPLAGVDVVIGYSELEGNALFDDYLVPSLKFNDSTPTSVVYEKSARFYTDSGVYAYSSLSEATKSFLERPHFQGYREFLTHFTMTCPSIALAAAASAKGAAVYHYASLGPQNFFEPVFSAAEIITFAKTGQVKWNQFSPASTTLVVEVDHRREEQRWQLLTCVAVKGIMSN
ncbi:acetylcholinesterase-1-like [Dermacentor albipictus]|uniref:acetylcholinesterase-1-like n=1 Tax=Dermacentor albipictus TaxID=60249 RepID=UPI0031FDBB0F